VIGLETEPCELLVRERAPLAETPLRREAAVKLPITIASFGLRAEQDELTSVARLQSCRRSSASSLSVQPIFVKPSPKQ
jgi:hypothetical protein